MNDQSSVKYSSRQLRSGKWWTFTLYLAWAWTVMTVTHELGHVVAGLIGGGRLVELELRPWKLPHSIVGGDTIPLVTLWAGPVLGTLLPLVVAAIARREAVWFVAWFCVTANSVYLLLGYFSGEPELDSTRLLAAGAHPLQIGVFVIATLPIGYIRFRNGCVRLLDGTTRPLTSRQLGLSFVTLVVTWVTQAVIASQA